MNNLSTKFDLDRVLFESLNLVQGGGASHILKKDFEDKKYIKMIHQLQCKHKFGLQKALPER